MKTSARKESGTRVLVLGAGGMLGHKLAQVFPSRFDTAVTVRKRPAFFSSNDAYARCKVIEGVSADRLESVASALDAVKPASVVNCIGVVKQVTGLRKDAESVQINALFPHQLADLCSERGIRLIHLSTYCVFSGKRGMYKETDTPDAADLYGRSKLLGEVGRDGCLTIRTSIIGREVGTRHGLVEWFLSNKGKSVKSYTKVVFSGFPTVVLADIIGNAIEKHARLSGVWHVSSEPIVKADLLGMLKKKMGLDIGLEPCADVVIDRSLDSSRFRAETGFKPISWPGMLDRMIEDAAKCGLYET